MLKSTILIFAGFTPLFVGFLLHISMVSSNFSSREIQSLVVLLIGLIVLGLHFFLGWASARFRLSESRLKTILLLNTAAILMFLINLYQVFSGSLLWLGSGNRFWIGMASHLFYSPLMWIAGTLLPARNITVTMSFSLILLIFSSFSGYSCSEKD